MTEKDAGARPGSPPGETDGEDLSGLTPPPEGGETSGATTEPVKEPPPENILGEMRRLMGGVTERLEALESRVTHGPTTQEPHYAPAAPAQPQTVEQQLANLSDEQINYIILTDDPEYESYKIAAARIKDARLEERVYRRVAAERIQEEASRRIQERGYAPDHPVAKRKAEIMRQMESDPEGFIYRAEEIATIMAEHELGVGRNETDVSEFQRTVAAAAAGADVGHPASPKVDDIELTPEERAQAERNPDPDWGAKMLAAKRELAKQGRGV